MRHTLLSTLLLVSLAVPAAAQTPAAPPPMVKADGLPTVFLTDLLHGKRSVDDQAEVAALKAAGIRDVGEVPAQLLADVPTLRG